MPMRCAHAIHHHVTEAGVRLSVHALETLQVRNFADCSGVCESHAGRGTGIQLCTCACIRVQAA